VTAVAADMDRARSHTVHSAADILRVAADNAAMVEDWAMRQVER